MSPMLTRSAVANRLGKSIATVRRLEDKVLHPVRDAKGVLWFSEDEVDQLVRHPTPAPSLFSRPITMRDRDSVPDDRGYRLDALLQRVDELERGQQAERARVALRVEEAERLAQNAQRELEAMERARQEHMRQVAADEAIELMRVRYEALEMLASLSARQLARMEAEDLEALIELAFAE